MPKNPTVAANNVFCIARKEAASFNDSLNSREGASELLGIDRTRIARIELGSLNPYPEEVLMMSDAYNAQELKYLAQFAEKQYEGAAANLGTRTPIHVVERKENYFSQGDGSEWLCEDTEYEVYKTFDEMLEDLRKSGKELPPYDEVEYEDVNDVWISDEAAYCEAYEIHAQRGTIIDTYRPVAFFLIRDEALRYRDGYQAHNCEDCRIYTYGLGYSNDGDLPVFRELLMKMGRQLAQGGEGK